MNQKVSGLYREIFSNLAERKAKGTELELRVDVDGVRPLNVISGDIYSNSLRTRKYLSSFIFQGIKKIENPTNGIILIGEKGKFSSDSDHFTDMQITIPLNSDPLKAAFQWKNGSSSISECKCEYVSKYFRSINLEHDYELGVVPLEPYETTDLISPSSYGSHPISIIDAFAEAGIEILIVKDKKDSVIPPKKINGKSVWTDDQLHEAMLKHFKSLEDKPQWNLWLLSAKEYLMSNINGITIRPKENIKRGCAVFQNATGWKNPEEKRMRLFIYVHELGHCFNLKHTWSRAQAKPTAEKDGYATLSWMNCPWHYCSKESRGEEAFWKAFNFQFSDSELVHLRHGFRNDVIFGGNAFRQKKGIESQNY